MIANPPASRNTAAATMSEEHPEIIQAKRKRNRRKKKKNTKAALANDDDDNLSVASSNSDASFQATTKTSQPSTSRPAPTILTPQESLRQSLIADGFSSNDVDQAMETMWDKGLAYDEYDAVKKFLETGGVVEDEDDDVHSANEETDPGDQGTVQTASTDDAAGEGESVSNSASLQDGDDDATTESTSKPSSSFHKPSMAAKLDMVARADKVTDAIFALTQWITKAAKPHELEDLCLAQKTKALVVVFQRGMEECVDQTMFDTAVLPGLVRLIFSTFSRCGIDFESAQKIPAEESMVSLLKQTRKVVMMEPIDEADNNKDIADKVATFIVSRMAEAVEEAKYALESSSPATVKIPSLMIKSQGIQVSSLISKRESQKQAAKRACAFARSSMEKVLQDGNNSSASSSMNGSVVDISALQLVDDATKARFEARKMRLEELKARVQEGDSEKVSDLKASVSELESERLNLQEKISELKVTLQKLEAQDEEVALKIGSLQGDIAEEQMTDSENTKKLQEQLRQAKEEARYGNLVGSLSGMMKAYAKIVETATTKSMQAVEGTVLPTDLASSKMEAYLRQVLGYFQTEAECLSLVKSRLEANKSKVSSLKLELEQVAGLGMNTTTSQIEDAVASKEEMIENDSRMLVAFTGEATSMLDDLISRLETYSGAVKTLDGLQPIHYDLLVDIYGEIEDTGIAGSDKLKKYIPESRAVSPVVMTEFTDTTASSVATPSPRANDKKMKKVAAAEGLPKLTWASASAMPSSSEHKTSFLDIQREELESKN